MGGPTLVGAQGLLEFVSAQKIIHAIVERYANNKTM